MNREEKRSTKISFPLALYFQQLFAADSYVRYINPFSFWRKYKINHLETCRELDTVKYLEHCYCLKSRSPRLSSINKNTEYIDNLVYIPYRKTDSNTIYISQPIIILKYRGVSYFAKDIYNIQIHCVRIDPQTIKLNSYQQPPTPDRPNTSNKSGSNQ